MEVSQKRRFILGLVVSALLHIVVFLGLIATFGQSVGGAPVQNRNYLQVTLVSSSQDAGSWPSAVNRRQKATVPTTASAPSETQTVKLVPHPAAAVSQDKADQQSQTEAAIDQPTANSGGSEAASSDQATAYEQILLAHINEYRGYPINARRAHTEGEVLLRFILDRNGHVRDAWIERSSGTTSLDAEALATIGRAQPLPPIPAGLPDRLDLSMPIVFHMRP